MLALALGARTCHNERVKAVLSTPKRRTRIVAAGVIYTIVVLVIGLAAGSRPNNLLIWVFACLLAAMVASGFVSGFMLMRVRARRIEPRRGRVGDHDSVYDDADPLSDRLHPRRAWVVPG